MIHDLLMWLPPNCKLDFIGRYVKTANDINAK